MTAGHTDNTEVGCPGNYVILHFINLGSDKSSTGPLGGGGAESVRRSLVKVVLEYGSKAITSQAVTLQRDESIESSNRYH